VTGQDYNARMAALWILHGAACVKLLKSHGRALHAENFEAALREFTDIVADEVGHDRLTEAMDWAADQVALFSGELDHSPASIH